MKNIWKKCWFEFVEWFDEQWKFAWDALKLSVIGLVQACFEWIKTILGGIFIGFWKLVIKPIGKYCYDKVIEWIEKI